jgi:hypothetical protein
MKNKKQQLKLGQNVAVLQSCFGNDRFRVYQQGNVVALANNFAKVKHSRLLSAQWYPIDGDYYKVVPLEK